MTLAIMQPYFFPYLGYYCLIKNSNEFIILDSVQFIRHGWIERNRILCPNGGWNYIKVPLKKHERGTLIKNIEIRNEEKWKKKIFAQLIHYKKIAPYYKDIINLLEDTFAFETESITHLNAYVLKNTCEYLDIIFNYKIFSESNVEIEPVNEPDEWALNISKVMGAGTYINPLGGVDFFNRSKFEKNNINLKFLKLNLEPYDQRRSKFESGLSIIDVMMFNSKKEIKSMLNNFELR